MSKSFGQWVSETVGGLVGIVLLCALAGVIGIIHQTVFGGFG